jgi:ankyrin repeat protein
MGTFKGRRALLVLLWVLLAPLLLRAQASSPIDPEGTGEQVQKAIASGADVNARDDVGRTVLMLAAATNQDERVISLLVAAGATVNARGPNGWTALMMAAYGNRNPRVVEALLKAGADGKFRSLAGRTAFEYAVDNAGILGSTAYADLKKAQY